MYGLTRFIHTFEGLCRVMSKGYIIELYRVSTGVRDVTLRTENQMEETTQNEVETGLLGEPPGSVMGFGV